MFNSGTLIYHKFDHWLGVVWDGVEALRLGKIDPYSVTVSYHTDIDEVFQDYSLEIGWDFDDSDVVKLTPRTYKVYMLNAIQQYKSANWTYRGSDLEVLAKICVDSFERLNNIKLKVLTANTPVPPPTPKPISKGMKKGDLIEVDFSGGTKAIGICTGPYSKTSYGLGWLRLFDGVVWANHWDGAFCNVRTRKPFSLQPKGVRVLIQGYLSPMDIDDLLDPACRLLDLHALIASIQNINGMPSNQSVQPSQPTSPQPSPKMPSMPASKPSDPKVWIDELAVEDDYETEKEEPIHPQCHDEKDYDGKKVMDITKRMFGG